MQVLYYTPEMLRALETMTVQALPHMEHRHVIQFMRLCVEPYITHCPLPLISTHLPPILVPFMSHLPLRLTVTWSGGLPPSTPITCAAEMESLIVGGLYIALEGLTTEEYETILDKSRRDVTREYMDALLKCLSLKGEVVQAMHPHAGRRGKGKDSGREKPQAMDDEMDSSMGSGGGGAPMAEENGGAEQRPMIEDFKDALTRFMVIENEDVAVRLLVSVVGALSWPDNYTCRRAIRLGSHIVETGSREPKLYPAFAQDLFREVIRALLSNDTWVVGCEDEMVSLACDIYRLVVIGDDLKDATAPRRIDMLNDAPRQLMLSLPGR